jgi:2-succinyl-6-hydroxy-2,4-cyclohexadiene-1-carboxylate synthase
MGARIGAHLAVAHPQKVKALVILDEGSGSPASFRDLPPEKIPDLDNLTSGWPTPYPTYEEAAKDLRKRFGRETNAKYFMESLVETVDGYDFMFSQRAMKTIGKCYKTWDHLLPHFQCPVLLVRVSNSWVLTMEKAEEMKTFIKDCTYCEITQSDHMVYADNPGDFYRAFDQFLDKIRK